MYLFVSTDVFISFIVKRYKEQSRWLGKWFFFFLFVWCKNVYFLVKLQQGKFTGCHLSGPLSEKSSKNRVVWFGALGLIDRCCKLPQLRLSVCLVFAAHPFPGSWRATKNPPKPSHPPALPTTGKIHYTVSMSWVCNGVFPQLVTPGILPQGRILIRKHPNRPLSARSRQQSCSEPWHPVRETHFSCLYPQSRSSVHY